MKVEFCKEHEGIEANMQINIYIKKVSQCYRYMISYIVNMAPDTYPVCLFTRVITVPT